jgi:hypothetical protein
MDAMFQPRPHGAIAVDPLTTSPYDFPGDVNCLLWALPRCKVARGAKQHRFGARPREASNNQGPHKRETTWVGNEPEPSMQ